MQRWFRLSSLLLALTAVFNVAHAAFVEVRGSLPPGGVRIFVRDTVYRISGTYTIGGTLIIEPGTRVEFLPNGRLIDSTGGRIIADGRASATYNPAAVNPLVPPYTGYDDLNYFGAAGVVSSTIDTEPTIDQSKNSVVFRVDLGANTNLQNLTPARAIMYQAARLNLGAVISAIRLNPWFRPSGRSINVTPARITFTSDRVNNFSREWGHIIVLPGARAAFFRDVDFVNFRKDTTVDNRPVYLANQAGQTFTTAQAETANQTLLNLTNGGGGAITTFSSRTWIVGCNFRNNMARYRGGAIQILQAPIDAFNGSTLQLYPTVAPGTIAAIPAYLATQNPWLIDQNTGAPISTGIRAIDNLGSTNVEPLNDSERQSLDDARIAVYLGRIRQSRFTGNHALVADVDTIRVGSVRIVGDVSSRAATVFGSINRSQRNEAFGGAMYISGRNPMTIGIGINDFQGKDTMEFTSNFVENRQSSTPVGNQVTAGARGGAVYVGDNTRVFFAGRYTTNRTATPFITTLSSSSAASVGNYSKGGAIYASAGALQIQVRGNVDNNPPTHFIGNESGRGGAICVERGTTDRDLSPWVGASDGIIEARNIGFNIKFRDNKASVEGGAIYTSRNMYVYGAGGSSGPLWIYGTNYGVEFNNNTANFSGGAITVNTPENLPVVERGLRFVRSHFINNRVGQITGTTVNEVRGGGALYVINADLNLVKGTEFRANKVWNGNGGAVAIVTPDTVTRKRFMVTDIDNLTINPTTQMVVDYAPRNEVFTLGVASPRPDERMLTRFYDNEVYANAARQGSGTTQRGDIKVTHPGTTLRENGTGLGGAVYILDSIRVRVDTFSFDRVRMQNNMAFSGAGVYSDNYDLKLAFARCLITGNKATSTIGRQNDTINGPLVNNENPASSDLAGAVMFGEVTGPLPWNTFSTAANSIYDNDARFVVRLPDAQDTKGVLAGTTGIGFGGVDTLRGNYWGRTEANVNTILPVSAGSTFGRIQQTFFVAGNGKTHMRFVRGTTSNLTEQGPFESEWRYAYTAIPSWTIPDTLLMQGRVYDIFDKGTDIKTADYSNRRMSPIEDFAVGVPPTLRLYADPLMPSYNKYVKRMTRNPYDADRFTDIAAVQTEYVGDHPIGYPLFIEARADYNGTAEIANNDARAINETVFFVINERTGDFIRVNMSQRTATDTIFRARVDFVPDSTSGGDPNIRRAYEGLATYGTGATLLANIIRNAIAEDSAALAGRRWEGSTTLGELGGADFRLNNRPTLPTSNTVGSDGGKETYYAGERYRALPVVNGDPITVISRTALWKSGVVDAINGALTFSIGNNTNPPVFTGCADTLPTSPLLHPEYRNRVFVTENRLYTPVTAAQSSRGPGRGSWFNEPASYPADILNVPIPGRDVFERDSIFSITAVDINRFYDPRVVRDPNFNAQLSYFWSIQTGNSGLQYWLRDTLVYAGSTTNNPRWSAVGYRYFRGRPINPYIVPGGELVEVVAKNFPPSVEIVDTLRKSGWNESEIGRWFYTYPSYFHAEEYDNNALPLSQRDPSNTNARYLQQDTVNYGWLDSVSYQFRIHVVDSMPRFLWNHRSTGPSAFANAGMWKGDTTIVLDPTTTDPDAYDRATGTYRDTLRMFNTTSRVGRRFTPAPQATPNNILDEVYNTPAFPDGRPSSQNDTLNIHFVANVTDSLRFRADINTDDEFEDLAAIDENRAVVKRLGAWDFRYGRTSYGFLSTSIRETPADTSLETIIQARPNWMSQRFLRRYESAGTADPFAEDFTKRGRLEVRINRDLANELLQPINDYDPGRPFNDDRNTDTVMTVVVNDGHGGINTLTRRLFVNFQPSLLPATLAEAVEDEDYNTQLIDSARRVKVYDPNFGQAQSFELIYADESRDSIAIDPYFTEAGFIQFDSTRKTTPNWLRINPTSGILYGTPRVTDVPYPDTTVQVTVLVTDAGGLRDIRTYDLTIRAKNHNPTLLQSPIIRCVDAGKPYTDTIRVTDVDLRRTQAGNEELTFEVTEPTGSWKFTPEKLSSPVSDTQRVAISTDNLQGNIVDGRIRIVVVVTDRQGAKDTLIYSVSVSDETRFAATIRVENNLGAFQNLTFGVGGTTVATRGDEQSSFGKLDSNYCEYELPPVPYIDVFDARWTIPTRNGAIRNIHPFSNVAGQSIYQGRFQAGGETGQSSNYYPVKITWCKDQIPAKDVNNPGSYYIRDDQSNGQLFDFNMKTGAGRSIPSVQKIEGPGSDCETLVINLTSIEGFLIVYDFTSPVNEEEIASTFGISKVAPNPFSGSTSITFNVVNTSKVSVDIFDAIGNRVATVANDVFAAGTQTVTWDGTSNGVALPSGTYTVRMSDGTNTATQQVVVIR